MILVDTSVWIDFLRHGDDHLARLLNRSSVLGHPCVTGELALGNLATAPRSSASFVTSPRWSSPSTPRSSV